MQGFIAFVAFIDIATALRNYVERRNFMWSNQEFTDLKLIEGNFSWCRRLFALLLPPFVCVYGGNVILSHAVGASMLNINIDPSRKFGGIYDANFTFDYVAAPLLPRRCDTLFHITNISEVELICQKEMDGNDTNTYDDDTDRISTHSTNGAKFLQPKNSFSMKKKISHQNDNVGCGKAGKIVIR